MSLELDWNAPTFQRDLLALDKNDRNSVLNTFARLVQMDWEMLYQQPGLNWEAVKSQTGPQGAKLYSLRVTQKMRLLCVRRGNALHCISLHPDHDSAYTR
ncbi:hypothetical protein [Deinococcus sp.]|uniref:hypothetical protein n=1 Tax=Deinococcus sp. TaxID=47478 RepID=UPI003B5BF8AC